MRLTRKTADEHELDAMAHERSEDDRRVERRRLRIAHSWLSGSGRFGLTSSTAVTELVDPNPVDLHHRRELGRCVGRSDPAAAEG